MSDVILFDLDLTLLDRSAYRHWAVAFASARSLPPEAVELLVAADDQGRASRQAVFGALVASYGLAESVDELIVGYRSDYPEHIVPDEEQLAALRRLKELGWLVGVVTNGPPSQVDKAERSGILPLLDVLVISELLGVAKPAPAIFEEALAQLGAAEDGGGQRWMVGDAPVEDIGGGRAAGLSTAWITLGRDWLEVGYAPDLVASTALEVVDLLLG